MKNKFKKSLVLILVISMLCFVQARGDFPLPDPPEPGTKLPLTKLYPEDYTWRSGLAYNIKYYEEVNGVQILVKEENNIWNSRYPFNDPVEIENYDITEHVKDNVGFKAKIIRYPGVENPLSSGRVSYSLAVIPYLEAKETILYDKTDSNSYQVFGEMTEFDIYGNPKKSYNLGYTGNSKYTTFLSPTYKNYLVKNPYYLDGSYGLEVSSEHTTFQTNSKLNYNELEKKDTLISETNYLYEKYPIIYPLLKSQVNENSVKGIYGFYGLTNLFENTIIKDGFGRIITETKTNYEVNKDNFEACGPSNQVEYEGCIKVDCDLDMWSLNPFEEASNPPCFESDIGDGDYCLRISPGQIISYGSDASRYLGGINGEKENIAISSINSKYDHCGNNLELSVETNYKHPFNNEELSTYTKTIQTDFSDQKIKPTSITNFGPPDITTSATYYADNKIKTVTDERGRIINYQYDELGRVKKIWIYPDTEESPTAEYAYDPNYDYLFEIYEKRKINNNQFNEAYHYYDGLGRYIQSKVYDDAGTPGDSSDDSVIITGKNYDANGRVKREYRPSRIGGVDELSWYDFDNLFFQIGVATYLDYEYDGFNRPIKITDSFDLSFSTNEYVLSENTGYKYNKLITTDSEQNIRTFYSDSKGNLMKVELPTIE